MILKRASTWETSGAMGIRTPDLLHAMQRRSVHHRPPPFTTDTADQPVRPQESARVHHRSLRTVTSLVTSHPRYAAPAQGNPGRVPGLSRAQEPAFTEATPGRVSRPLAIAVTRACEPSPALPDPGEPLTGLQPLEAPASLRHPMPSSPDHRGQCTRAAPERTPAARSDVATSLGAARALTWQPGRRHRRCPVFVAGRGSRPPAGPARRRPAARGRRASAR
jgi:hypothetical protein